MDAMRLLVQTAWTLIFWISVVMSYPTGAPSTACPDMYPSGHGSSPQVTNTPYYIEVSDEEYLPGIPMSVSIRGAATFKGFMLQARSLAKSKPIGRWVSWVRGAKIMSCLKTNDTLTHSVRENQEKTVAFWVPAAYHGPFNFIATIVLEQSTYWMNVTSPVVYPSNRHYIHGKYVYPGYRYNNWWVNTTAQEDEPRPADPVLTMISLVVGYVGTMTMFSVLLI